MSMPSSRLLVATTRGSRPRLRSSSMIARCSLDTEPWWARRERRGRRTPAWRRACAAPVTARPASRARRVAATLRRRLAAYSSLSRAVSRSASRRELANTMVERCCCDQVDDPLLDVRPDRPGARARPPPARSGSPVARAPARSCPRRARRPAGRTASRCGGATIVDRGARRRGSARPPRPAARSPTARCAGPAASSSASSRSRESARWAPRLVAGHRVHLVDDDGLDAAPASRGPAR